MFLSIWVPVILAGCIADTPASRARSLRDRRALIAGAAALAAELVLMYALGRGVGPLRALIGMFRGQTSSQSVSDWCLAVLVCLPAAAGIGCAVRYLMSAVRREKRAWEPVERRKKALLALLALCASVPLLLGLNLARQGEAQLRLQEICREQTVVTAEGERGDASYVILKNNGSLPCETGGMVLASDADDRTFRLPARTIAPGATLRFETAKEQFVDIRKSGGTTVRLLTESGAETDAVLLPEMPDDLAYRRTASGWETCLTDTAVVETANLAAPTFSAPGGFYDEAFSLALSAPEGCEIRYTLDGAVPTPDSARYTGPIRVYDRSAEPNRFRAVQNVQEDYLNKAPIGEKPVDKAFIVRAAAFDADGNRGPVVTETYFVGLADYRGRAVISLIADPEDLFGDNGIYVTGPDYDAWYAEHGQEEDAPDAPLPNYLQHGIAWERPANLELYEDGAAVLNQPVGVRILGNSSRTLPLKRFSVYARKAYGGSRVFDAPVFPGTQTHSMALRTGLDNALSNLLLEGRRVGVLRAIPTVVFVNGEFWYEAFRMEKVSDTFISETYGVAKDDVECIDIGLWAELPASEQSAYRAMLDAVQKQGGTDREQYDAINDIIDIDSFVDFVCANIYLGNTDCGERHNTCVWHTKTNEFTEYGDGRWRWILKDMDLNHGAAKKYNGYTTSAQINTFRDRAGEDEAWPYLLQGNTIWETLKDNAVFRRQFVVTFMDLVNTTFAPGRVEQLLRALDSDLSYDDDFYRVRAGYITRYMEQELGLTGTQETLTITTDTPDAGTVTLNTIKPDLSGGSWSGVYYTDYPVTLTAEPAEGHVFVAWEVNGERLTEPTIEADILRGGSNVHVIFQ